jgi:hypothetical protein
MISKSQLLAEPLSEEARAGIDTVVVLPIGSMRFAGFLDGAGLANQAIQWAKGFALGQAIDARVVILHPLTSAHRYRQELGLSRGRDLLPLVRALATSRGHTWVPPRHLIDRHGEDFDREARRLRAGQPGSSLLVPIRRNHTGLFAAGASGIPRLRAFLGPWLEGPSLLAAESVRLVAHLRAGDFAQNGSPLRPGEVNRRWPMTWTRDRLVAAIRATHLVGCQAQVSVVSDDPRSAEELLEHLLVSRELAQDEVYRPRGHGVPTDLGLLQMADYVVPSGSTFSLLALALGDALHCWHADHLAQRAGYGWLTDHFCPGGDRFGEEALAAVFSGDPESLIERGMAVGDGAPSESEMEWLTRRLRTRRAQGGDVVTSRSLDLVAGGVVKILHNSSTLP